LLIHTVPEEETLQGVGVTAEVETPQEAGKPPAEAGTPEKE